jgi:hypothetical protein
VDVQCCRHTHIDSLQQVALHTHTQTHTPPLRRREITTSFPNLPPAPNTTTGRRELPRGGGGSCAYAASAWPSTCQKFSQVSAMVTPYSKFNRRLTSKNFSYLPHGACGEREVRKRIATRWGPFHGDYGRNRTNRAGAGRWKQRHAGSKTLHRQRQEEGRRQQR